MGTNVTLRDEAPGYDLDDLVGRARLPMSLNVAGRIFMELDSPSSSLDDIAEIIVTDVGLSARVLKIANSPLFMGGGIDTVAEALVYVGLDDVVSLVAASEIVRAFEDIPFHDNPYRFWYENLYAATAGQVLARHVCLPEGRLFTACLLRGVGELIIRACLPEAAEKITQAVVQTGVVLHRVEKDILGFNHAELGAALLDRWQLPPSLVTPVRCYIDPQGTQDYHLEAAIVNLANFLKNEYYEITQPELQNNLLHDDIEKSRELIDGLKPEIERLNADAIKLVMG
jgi:HD-like signal output (HDOD) protein